MRTAEKEFGDFVGSDTCNKANNVGSRKKQVRGSKLEFNAEPRRLLRELELGCTFLIAAEVEPNDYLDRPFLSDAPRKYHAFVFLTQSDEGHWPSVSNALS